MQTKNKTIKKLQYRIALLGALLVMSLAGTWYGTQFLLSMITDQVDANQTALIEHDVQQKFAREISSMERTRRAVEESAVHESFFIGDTDQDHTTLFDYIEGLATTAGLYQPELKLNDATQKQGLSGVPARKKGAAQQAAPEESLRLMHSDNAVRLAITTNGSFEQTMRFIKLMEYSRYASDLTQFSIKKIDQDSSDIVIPQGVEMVAEIIFYKRYDGTEPVQDRIDAQGENTIDPIIEEIETELMAQ